MAIRIARYRDLNAINRICADAFFDDVFFGDFMHTRRREHPEGMLMYFARRNREKWFDWKHVWLVSYTNDESGNEVVTGFADWVREGSSKQMGLWWLDPRNLIQPSTRIFNNVLAWIYPDRAAHPDPSRLQAIQANAPFIEHHWSGDRADSWYLDLLAVDPSYHRQGYGRKLVKWGLDKAADEGVCASTISSSAGEHLYISMGISDYVGSHADGEGNPLAGVEGKILFTLRK